MWEHYLFSEDKDFLAKRAYPIMKESVQFFMDFLIKHPKYGWMVTAPSLSPEQGDVCAGPTMDNHILRALFENTIEAANILNVDKDFVAKVAQLRKQLPPNLIGKHGQLQEWLEDIDIVNNNHRHMSPLWGRYGKRRKYCSNGVEMEAPDGVLHGVYLCGHVWGTQSLLTVRSEFY
jgi:alpha-L-fucosidase 2